mmetsp:Transcript_34401/g.110564  ORF Transcript_34401/g.110564 Transcript_34401/m.110564 type:complete len:270 (+) Transcript_34401:1360-2169(+)
MAVAVVGPRPDDRGLLVVRGDGVSGVRVFHAMFHRDLPRGSDARAHRPRERCPRDDRCLRRRVPRGGRPHPRRGFPGEVRQGDDDPLLRPDAPHPPRRGCPSVLRRVSTPRRQASNLRRRQILLLRFPRRNDLHRGAPPPGLRRLPPLRGLRLRLRRRHLLLPRLATRRRHPHLHERTVQRDADPGSPEHLRKKWHTRLLQGRPHTRHVVRRRHLRTVRHLRPPQVVPRRLRHGPHALSRRPTLKRKKLSDQTDRRTKKGATTFSKKIS